MATSTVAAPLATPDPLMFTMRRKTVPPPPAVTIYRTPYQGFGQCKAAATILADQGDIVHVVTDVPHTVRSKRKPAAVYRGARPMHRSTLKIPMQNGTDYGTTSQKFHGGKKDLVVGEKVQPYPSQHTNQFDFAHETANNIQPANPAENWATNYGKQFPFKGVEAPARLHYPTFNNKMNMNEGGGIRGVMTAPDPTHGRGHYWSQYNRIHNRLGAALGPGVERDRVIRSSYNPLTGNDMGPAWKPENQRTSGNRVLYNDFGRKDAERFFMY